MQETRKIEGTDAAAPKSGLWGWIDRRTAVDAALRSALYEPILGGARFAYVFGSRVYFYSPGNHRRFSGALLHSVRGSRTHDCLVHHESGYCRLFSAQPARLRRQRHDHRAAAAPFANLYLWGLQGPA